MAGNIPILHGKLGVPFIILNALLKRFSVITILFVSLAIPVTAFRLWIRHKRMNLWWDDLWVAISALATVAKTIITFVHTSDLSKPATNII
jgi:hypothetical protein